MEVKESYYPISKSLYQPFVSAEILDLNGLLLSHFDLADYCIWTTAWFNEFAIHQVVNHYTFIEVDKDMTESVFYFLRDKNLAGVFVEPDRLLMDRYVSETPSPIIINKLFSRSPIQVRQEQDRVLKIPSLEKLLLDLFLDGHLLDAFKGSEQTTIFKHVFQKYHVNIKKLMTYAKRKRQVEALKKYLKQNGLINV